MVKITEVGTTFNISIRGASHIASGKPCQDYSLSYEREGVSIVVVCDGHGGSTYCRSDIGAKYAAEITLEILKGFAASVSPDIFSDLDFAITAKPTHNPFLDPDGKKMRFEELNDNQKRYALQAQSYFVAEEKCKKQQSLIEDLLHQIYTAWKNQIHRDAKVSPFTMQERTLLNGKGVEKAYGCTLLAFLKTDHYWLSFHIGDGEILICDNSLSWKKPVPDDCSCFLNYTTSLCDGNPLSEFRYAFNGKGDFPFAVILCSDGVDGSLRTQENLHDFYEQIINLFIDGDNVEDELDSYLPKLSENGNKDDISISGFVDLCNVDTEQIRKTIELKRKSRELKNEYNNRKLEIDRIAEKIENLKIKYERQKDLRFDKQAELDDIKRHFKAKEDEVSNLEVSINSIRNEIESLREQLKSKTQDFNNWKFTVKNEMAQNEAELKDNDLDDDDNSLSTIESW